MQLSNNDIFVNNTINVVLLKTPYYILYIKLGNDNNSQIQINTIIDLLPGERLLNR